MRDVRNTVFYILPLKISGSDASFFDIFLIPLGLRARTLRAWGLIVRGLRASGLRAWGVEHTTQCVVSIISIDSSPFGRKEQSPVFLLQKYFVTGNSRSMLWHQLQCCCFNWQFTVSQKKKNPGFPLIQKYFVTFNSRRWFPPAALALTSTAASDWSGPTWARRMSCPSRRNSHSPCSTTFPSGWDPKVKARKREWIQKE